jgi:hypothetical protein
MGWWRRRRLMAWPWCAVCAVLTSATGFAVLQLGLAPSAAAASLTGMAWAASDTTPGATDVSYTYTYTYTFTTATTSALDSVTMTVPAGTGGTPAVGAVSPASVAAGGSVSPSGETLTYTFTSAVISAGTAVSVEIAGLTNTATAGSYPSTITTSDADTAVDSGTAPAVTLAGSLTLTTPDTLSWSATLTGFPQDAVDAVPADQQLTVDDSTGSGDGWHITIAATTFTSGALTLPDTGIIAVTGSATSLTGAVPSAACVGSCVPPTDTITYPVLVSTAASSPPATTIYDAAAGTDTGTVTLGGSGAADPLGWWLSVPATAYTGSYSSTLTLAVVSGP